MAKRGIGQQAFVVAGLLLGTLGSAAVAQELSENALRQIRAIYADKATWTPAQRKLATSLLYASRESRGQAMVQGLQPLRRIANRARVDREGTVVVDIRADVTDGLLNAIAGAGGRVAVALPAYGAVRARLPVRQVEAIAALPEVRFIGPEQRFLVNTGAVTSEGDTAHAAALARSTFSIDGTGVKVGVLSDGVDSLAARQATDDLPKLACPQTGACVTVVPGQAGSGDEGTAMMEIVHDLAPGAQLYFATALPTDAQFATNILALKNTYGCDIIVDDITYLNEGAFQDGVIAQAVNTVKAAGALFFSSAGNSGRKDAGTSGTWEGDFLDSGTAISVFDGSSWQGLPIHTFNGLTGGSSANSDQLCPTSVPDSLCAPNSITLKWSDPLGGAITDYDIFILDSSLTNVLDGSAIDQTVGGEDPYEQMGFGLARERIVIVRWSGPAKALRLDTNRGRLSISTAGAIVGHNGGEGTISVAATDGRIPGVPKWFVGGATNPVETYSSDGPRRMFYNPNGTAITSGKVTFASGGGRDLQKPDITAADCVTVTTPTFSPFCGTSAAAPHAGAIAALLLSASPAPTPAAVAAAMASTALDVNPVGWDRNAGAGIVMAVRTFADVAVAMTGPASVARGADVAYTIVITNGGLSDAGSVQVSDATPAGLSFVSNTGDCVSAFPCPLGSLAPGETRTITATFSVPSGYSGPSPFTNTATVTSAAPDPIPGNNSSSAQAAVVDAADADLSITKTGPASVARGADVSYTIVVTNSGPSNAASVQVSDAAPAGLSFVSNTGDCTTDFPCSLGSLASGATRTITSTFSVPADYSGSSPFTNTATVSSTTTDLDSGNNSSSAQTTVALVSPGDFFTLDPCRVFDTRLVGAETTGAPLRCGVTYDFTMVGGTCGLPSSAKAISLNVTVTAPSAQGSVLLFASGTSVPPTPILYYVKGLTRANNAVASLGANGKLSVRCSPSGTSHVIVDVNGYFE